MRQGLTLAAAGVALLLAAGTAMAREAAPLFSIGAIADAQYADEPDAPPRLYHTTPAKLEAAVADFNRQKLDFVVHLGDFVDRDWASYDAVLPIARKLRHPLHFVLGNHEFAIDDAHKRAVPARLGMPARYYAFDRHGWRFLVTDGNGLSSYAWPQGSAEYRHSMELHDRLYADRPLWDGGIDETQMAWIETELAEADAKGLKVMIFCHFPLYPDNPHNLWNAADVIAMLERHASVKIWLDGHNHDGNYGEKAGIHYVNMKAMLDTEETSYARLDFFADRVVLHGTGRQADMTLMLR